MASIGEAGNYRYIRKEYGLADYEQEPREVYSAPDPAGGTTSQEDK